MTCFIHQKNVFGLRVQLAATIERRVSPSSLFDSNVRMNVVGVMKIFSQLNSIIRAELAGLQGVSQSLYSEIDPLHLPEVLALVCRYHGQGELYVALKSSIAVAGVISTVNRKQCLQQQRAHHEAVIAERSATTISESRSSKRRRA